MKSLLAIRLEHDKRGDRNRAPKLDHWRTMMRVPAIVGSKIAIYVEGSEKRQQQAPAIVLYAPARPLAADRAQSGWRNISPSIRIGRSCPLGRPVRRRPSLAGFFCSSAARAKAFSAFASSASASWRVWGQTTSRFYNPPPLASLFRWRFLKVVRCVRGYDGPHFERRFSRTASRSPKVLIATGGGCHDNRGFDYGMPVGPSHSFPLPLFPMNRQILWSKRALSTPRMSAVLLMMS